jgi:hypothetical protein
MGAQECKMVEQRGVIVERVRDDGQWFDVGLRVECDGRGTLEKAALGAYEVLGCTREEADGRRWLSVRLRRFAQA